MRRIASVLFVCGFVLLAGAGIAQAATTVATEDFVFDPKSISIDPGEEITFDNTGNVAHTATSVSGSRGDRPNRNVDTVRVANQAPATPSATPASDTRAHMVITPRYARSRLFVLLVCQGEGPATVEGHQ